MIKGVHAMIYTSKPEEARAFLRDVLELPATDVGEGWLIFTGIEGEMGCHPAEKPSHGISLYTDDVDAAVERLREKGVVFTCEVQERGWGRAVDFLLPGGVPMTLYQKRYCA